MTKEQELFLELAVVKKQSYDKIAVILGIKRNVFSIWWKELKPQREHLSSICSLHRRKCPEIQFEDFKSWYEKIERKCFYCHITEDKLSILWEKDPGMTKRTRGRKLEIDRMEPNLPYSTTPNLVLSCYWCNNAKTDTFTSAEFEEIGKVIKKIWQKRLK